MTTSKTSEQIARAAGFTDEDGVIHRTREGELQQPGSWEEAAALAGQERKLAAGIAQDVLQGLREFYPHEIEQHADELMQLAMAAFTNSGNAQRDYEAIRDAVERTIKSDGTVLTGEEVKLEDGPDEDEIRDFLTDRIESGDLPLEDITKMMARYGLMDPAAFRDEMEERMAAWKAEHDNTPSPSM